MSALVKERDIMSETATNTDKMGGQVHPMVKPTFAERCEVAAKCLPPSPFKDCLVALHTEMLTEIDELSQNTCSECGPENYGWIFNRVEGKAACGCMTEAEPFQILLKALERIAEGKCETGASWLEAKAALKAVLPLDYAECAACRQVPCNCPHIESV